ncbi:hypothetical protein LIER_05038 [Lithospermum erythrorhizon]|uniref:C2 domain-containing protein n=1 Tax=Lithospermum erythrorhizon TaxID=34254 RepID=A0AAV3P0J1_LITER
MKQLQEIKYRNLYIRLVSTDDLKNIKIFGKMSVYAFIYILGHPKSKKKTVVDKNCGTRPRWNNKMSFPIEERTITIPGLTLLVQIKAKKFCRDNKVLGEVYILIPELFQRAGIVGNEEQNGERVIDYQVNTLSGRGKGNLKIAYAFGEKSSYDIIDDVEMGHLKDIFIIIKEDILSFLNVISIILDMQTICHWECTHSLFMALGFTEGC